MRLSILDQSVWVAGRGQDDAIRDTLDLAVFAEGLGYHRFWVSEHHGLPTIVGTAPEVLMAAIAARTTRIRIGSADVFVSYGLHRYTIHYTMTRMARRFDDHDEVYWNATGNYWVFPIETAVATVRLPQGADITDIQGYTGGQGQREQAVTITRQSDTVAVIRAARPFEVKIAQPLPYW